ncbi:DUF2924 domain-containing protein [Palleronia abyssalis]|uniref:Bacteriophage-related protein n=1 Tax=Palleronia abyssalis TaxID=1501240 RepID=A0A2R8BXZ5_9RHOB|nr:DUF2924 domain-containing protein [Palleronia abyssalis]SPJ25044.1 hypothetical protein PAA8504_02887 [Palleronia abyssalis]
MEDVTIDRIEAMDREALLALWRATFGAPPPKRLSRPFLRRFIAFELQARRHGGLSPAVQKKLVHIAAGKDRPKARRIHPGGRLIREWNGTSHVVDITETGYAWRGRAFRSLSAIAREITGAHWSGPRFFGLTGSGTR